MNDKGEIECINGYHRFSEVACLGYMTKYDVRNYSQRDALALRIAYLVDKTWIRKYVPNGWSSIHGAAKRTGEHRAWGIGKPLLEGMVEKVTRLLKRTYSNDPERLKDLVSTHTLSEAELKWLIYKHKVENLSFVTASEVEINARTDISDEWRPSYLRGTVDQSEDSEALILGRAYLSDIAMNAYVQLTNTLNISKDDSFVGRVLKSIDTLQGESNARAALLIYQAIDSLEIYRAIFR